jgi:hypothetical protein
MDWNWFWTHAPWTLPGWSWFKPWDWISHVMTVLRQWKEFREASHRERKARIEADDAQYQSEKQHSKDANELLWLEAKAKQREQHPRGNVTWPEAWYRENFNHLTESNVNSFILWLRQNGKL